MDDSRNITKDRQQDVNEEIGTTASLEEDTERRKDDGKNDLANVAGTKSVTLQFHEALS